jgi:hypothetical protein
MKHGQKAERAKIEILDFEIIHYGARFFGFKLDKEEIYIDFF